MKQKTKDQLISELKEIKKQNRDLIDNLLDAVIDTVFVFDPVSKKPLRWNRAFREISGYSDEEIKKKKAPDDWYSKKDLERASLEIKKLLNKEKSVLEMSLITKNRKRIPTEYTASVILDEKKNPEYIIAVGRDLTERKKAEMALRESEEKYRLLIENIPTVAWASNEKGETIFISSNVEKVYGYSPEEIYRGGADLWFGRVHPGDIDMVKTRIEKLIQKKEEYDIQYRIQRKDGEWIWIHDQAVSRQMVDSRIYAFGVFSDITSQIQTEKALVEQEKLLRTLYNAPVDTICVIDKDGFTVDINESGAKRLGGTRENLIGKKLDEIMDPDVARSRWKHFRSVFKKGSPIEFEDQRMGRCYLNRMYPIFNEEGRVYHVVVFATDITERKRTEQEITELNRNLEGRVKERTQQLENANKELESFSYSVSHDLQVPLRAIKGFSQLLLEKHSSSLDPDGQKLLKRVCRNTQNMSQLINDLLAFSRLERQFITWSSLEIGIMAKESVKQLGYDIRKKEINLKVCKMPETYGDANLIREVIINLLSNAIKFKRGSTPLKIEVGGEPGEEFHTYYVKDNGIGFDMRFKDKIFGVFERLHSPKEYEGTGIGLALVQRIVHRHGGYIWAEGKVNRGATFYFTLPAIKIE